jgi:hypothetical protein
MASTITVPNFQRIGTSIPAVAEQLVAVATAAKADLDDVDAGRSFVVDLATAAALPAGTYSNAAGTFTVTATGTLTVDSVVTALNDTILVKDQVSTFQNGLYKVTTAGAGGVSAVLTRLAGATTADAFLAGTLVSTGPAGTANPSTAFMQTSADCATLGTSAITYGLAVTTAPDAATGTKGITKMSVAPASAASPIAVGTNDPRVTTYEVLVDFDATDGSLAEQPFPWVSVAGTLTAVSIEGNAAVTQSDTDYCTITLGRRDGAGGAATTMASATTKTTGGIAVLAFRAVSMGALSATAMLATDKLTIKSVVSGAGQAVGPCILKVTYTVP